jgi:glycosyltransferase involved in cell wall biosynthesis
LVEQEEGMDFSFREKLVRLRGKIRRGWLLKSARLATVVSKTHQCILKRQYRLPVEVVYNGYDSTLSPARFLPDTRSKLRIVYVGRLLSQWYRDPSVLFGGLDRLFSSGRMRPDDVEVCFYGTEPGILEGILGRFGCHHVVRIEPRVNHSEIPHVLARASVLLVLTNRGRQGVLTTKLFEYLPMKKPILCVPGDGGELDELLRETRVGCSCADAESVGDTLWHWHSQWKNNGAIPVNANARCIERFSRRRQTRVFAELLDRVVEAAERGRATLA